MKKNIHINQAQILYIKIKMNNSYSTKAIEKGHKKEDAKK